MASYSIGEAKTHLSKLVAAAERGERVEISRGRGRDAVALLVPVAPESGFVRKPGALTGEIEMAADFDEFPDDLARDFGLDD